MWGNSAHTTTTARMVLLTGRTAVTWGLGMLQPHMSLHTMEMYTKEVGKIDPKKIIIAVLKERKIASSYLQSIL